MVFVAVTFRMLSSVRLDFGSLGKCSRELQDAVTLHGPLFAIARWTVTKLASQQGWPGTAGVNASATKLVHMYPEGGSPQMKPVPGIN